MDPVQNINNDSTVYQNQEYLSALISQSSVLNKVSGISER
jgi:hypothetical protein